MQGQVRYDASISLPLVPPPENQTGGAGGGTEGGEEGQKDFLSDDTLGLYYGGDFCSFRLPGVEAAALSAVCPCFSISLFDRACQGSPFCLLSLSLSLS